MKLEKTLSHRQILILILFLSFFLRLYHLGEPSLWFDKTLTASKTRIPFNHIIRMMAVTGEENPPGYFFLINIWSGIFGNSELSLRFPSLIFSLLSILTIYYLGKNLFSPRVGLIAAFLLSISPYNINYAQEARMYTLFWFLGIFSLLMFYRFLRSGNTMTLATCAAGNILALSVSYMGGFFILSQNVVFFALFQSGLIKK